MTIEDTNPVEEVTAQTEVAIEEKPLIDESCLPEEPTVEPPKEPEATEEVVAPTTEGHTNITR